MDSGLAASWILVPMQILFLDLVLSGDNAAVIAMACRTLPKRDASKAIVLGAAGAIVLRVLLTAIAGVLISIPYLKLVSAFLLIVIAVNLSAAEPGEAIAVAQPEDEAKRRGDIVGAALVIVMADAVMSLDNVVALAAVSAGNFWLLVAGLALSIPILVFGSAALSLLLDRYPALAAFGGLLLGWTAGDIAATDAAYADWAARQAPALAYALPITGAVFVFLQSRWIVAERNATAPARRSEPKPASRSAKPLLSPDANSGVKAGRAASTVSVSRPLSSAATTQAQGPSGAKAAEADSQQDDLVMLLGLLGLCAVFGIFIGYVVFFAS